MGSLLEPVALPGTEELAFNTRGGERVALRTGLSYGVGMVGERLFRDAPALLLLVFMTNYLSIPAAWAGVAIFFPKLLLVNRSAASMPCKLIRCKSVSPSPTWGWARSLIW
jgi:hypothetical protein